MTVAVDLTKDPPGQHREAETGAPPPRQARRTARYSRFVGMMRVLLPALAVALLGAVMAWPQLAGRDGRFAIGVSGKTGDRLGADTLTMVNPRYYGVDAQERPFSVAADLALQESSDAAVITLEEPRADMTLKDGSGVLLDAREGLYWRKDQVVELYGGVDLFHDKGYELHTPVARVELSTGGAEGHEGVEGQGPAGHVRAEGFRVLDRGRIIQFTGKTHLVLHPRTAEAKR